MVYTGERQKSRAVQAFEHRSSRLEASFLASRPNHTKVNAYAHAINYINSLNVCQVYGKDKHELNVEETREIRMEKIIGNSLFKRLPEGLRVRLNKNGEACIYNNKRIVPLDKLEKYLSS